MNVVFAACMGSAEGPLRAKSGVPEGCQEIILVIINMLWDLDGLGPYGFDLTVSGLGWTAGNVKRRGGWGSER